MISPLGQKAVQEISTLTGAPEAVVMRAFLLVGLKHQAELVEAIGLIEHGQIVELPYIFELEAS